MSGIDLSKTSHQITTAAAVVTALGVLGAVLGVDWPLTENSPVIQQSIEFDEYHDLKMRTVEIAARADRRRVVLIEMRSIRLLMTQWDDKPDMTPQDRENKAEFAMTLLELTEEYKALAPEK